MAALPLNTFKTYTRVVDDTEYIVYTAPLGITAIVLMAQITNLTNLTQEVNFFHVRETLNQGTVTTEIVVNYPVPGYDTLSLLSGKLVLESGDSISVSSNASSGTKFICSILETSAE
jgi:hypothetical protein